MWSELYGEMSGNMDSCMNQASVTALYGVGGIASFTGNGNITRCANFGNIKATGKWSAGDDSIVGGLVARLGDTGNTNMSDCYNRGNVSGAYETVGSLIAILGSTNGYRGDIVRCYSTTDGRIVANNILGTSSLCFYFSNVSNISIDARNLFLGGNFFEDDYNINDGFPILYWQK